MKDLKKILHQGLEAANVLPEDYNSVEDYLNTEMFPAVRELKSRLGMDLYNYKLEVKYIGDCPQSFKHILDFDFEENSPALNLTVGQLTNEIFGLLLNGDDEIFLKGLTHGIQVIYIAE